MLRPAVIGSDGQQLRPEGHHPCHILFNALAKQDMRMKGTVANEIDAAGCHWENLPVPFHLQPQMSLQVLTDLPQQRMQMRLARG